MDDRLEVRVSLFNSYEDETRWTVPEAVEWLNGLLAKIPEEFRASSIFQVELDGGHWDDYRSLTFAVYYDRPETDGEYAARKAKQEADRMATMRQHEARERAAYEQLKAKYG